MKSYTFRKTVETVCKYCGIIIERIQDRKDMVNEKLRPACFDCKKKNKKAHNIARKLNVVPGIMI